MPQFHLDTRGQVLSENGIGNRIGNRIGNPRSHQWTDFDSFTQGYIEALFFTECEHGSTREGNGARRWNPETDSSLPENVAFADLAPETLERIAKDCEAFQEQCRQYWAEFDADDDQAGRDFWFTRNGHGVGFWDREAGMYQNDGAELTAAAKAFGEVWAYLGDDGKVYLS